MILQQPPVLDVDVDVADDDAGNITSRVSSDVSSADTSTRRGTEIIGKEMTVASEVEGEYPPLPDDYSFNYSASSPNLRGGGVKTDSDNDDDDDLAIKLTDEQVGKYIFFERLAHYLLFGWASYNRSRKAVELAIAAEAGTYVRGLNPMKRAKQEDIFMRTYLHVLNEIEDNLFEHKQVREAMLLNNKGAKRGGGSLPQQCIGNIRPKLIISTNLQPNIRELVTCLNCRVVRHR